MTFNTWYTTISHNLLIKVFSEIRNLVFKSTAWSRIGLSKNHFTGHQKVVQENTSQEKLWLMPSHFSLQNVFTFGNKCSNKTLTCDIDMWHWHVTLACDIDMWHWYVTLACDIDMWHWHVTLAFLWPQTQLHTGQTSESQNVQQLLSKGSPVPVTSLGHQGSNSTFAQ